MGYDWEETAEETSVRTRTLAGTIRAGVSYGLFALGVLAFWSFFAAWIGLPAWEWHAAILPEMWAPTEHQTGRIDVSPLIAGILTASVAVWIR